MGRGVAWKPMFAFVAMATGSPAAAGSEGSYGETAIAPAFRVLIPGKKAAVLHRRLAGAQRRLARKRCQAVLSEFSDAAGVPLAQRLEESGSTPQGYLGQVLFASGSAVRSCASSKVLAVTSPGSKVVFICPGFVQVAHLDPVEAELVLIHELLHTLGLGESPPSSLEITGRVERRCRR